MRRTSRILGALVVRMKGGFDYKRECSLPFAFGEMTDVGKTGRSALASDWQLQWVIPGEGE